MLRRGNLGFDHPPVHRHEVRADLLGDLLQRQPSVAVHLHESVAFSMLM
jgi:hypothetical protein